MKVGIVGAGAVGGLIGARLAAQGHTLSLLARGDTLAALQREGLRLQLGAEQPLNTYPVRAAASGAELGTPDLVVIALKAYALPAVAPQVAAMLGPDTTVLVAMNGVPWWFFDGMPGEPEGVVLSAVDPAGDLRRHIPTRHVMGCVVHLTAASPEPGLCRLGFGNGLIVGEPAGGATARAETIAATLRGAGFDVTVSERIQNDIWYKLWGNMTMNPISALTGATCDRILDDAQVNALCCTVMREAAAVGERIGCPIAQNPEDRNAVTRKLGAFKTSMLQDVERGKPLEIDALLTAVVEIAERVRVPVPHTSALLGLTRLMGQTRGLLP